MESGKLRHALVIEENLSTDNTHGDRLDNWVVFARVRGSLHPLTGREFFTAQQYESEVKSKARIRYRAGITTAMRVLHGGLIYNIVFVQNIEMRNREIVLMLSEGLRD